MMFEAKRLHPISIFIQSGKTIKRFIFSLVPFVFIKHSGKDIIIFGLIALMILVLAIFLISLLSWVRYTYRMENGELRIEYGLFIRKKRYIPVERIQSLDLSEGVLQQMFGLVKVQVETAGGGHTEEAEIVLTAIAKLEAQILQNYVASSKNIDDLQDNQALEPAPIYRISSSELLLLSLTSGGAGVVVSAVMAFLSQLDNFIPYKKLFGRFEHWAESSIITVAVLVFIGLLLAWLIAFARTMLKYANFTLVKSENELIISQGLLEKRRITVPIKRIQAVRISENMIRQLLGYATVYIESAGGSSTHIESSKVMLLPMVRLKRVAEMIEPNLKEYRIISAFNPVPKKALIRYIIRSWYIPVPIVIASLVFLKIWGFLSFILLGVMTVLAVLKYKSAGWNIDSQQLSLRFRGIVRTTVFMRRNKIQSLEIRESYFQRRKNLGTIKASIKSGAGPSGGAVVDLRGEDMKKIYHWYSRYKKQGLHL
jgi:putative membrane protein